jgi:predicted ThiF/HesA family dinucleotide-utilizing enzyme
VHAEGTITATFSGVFRGGPLAVRLLDGRKVMRPGVVHFDPEPGNDSFSFTFVHKAEAQVCGRRVKVQIKALGAEQVTLKAADAVVTYKTGTGGKSGTCA